MIGDVIQRCSRGHHHYFEGAPYGASLARLRTYSAEFFVARSQHCSLEYRLPCPGRNESMELVVTVGMVLGGGSRCCAYFAQRRSSWLHAHETRRKLSSDRCRLKGRLQTHHSLRWHALHGDKILRGLPNSPRAQKSSPMLRLPHRRAE